MRVGIITRDAFAHVSAVGICTGILFLFVALTYSRITLPRYTTDYTEKDVQQVVNLIIAVVATVVGILFSHCRRLTNEAETRAELRDEKLTVARLHVHFEAASGSKVAMGIPVAQNKEVYPLVAYYFLAMIVFAFVHSVLSVIFVIEAIISEIGEPVPVPIPLSADIPFDHDPCINDVASPACTYVLALHSLSSQLVTYQPYVIAGVTFDPPNGTMGLPYYAMKHFADEVSSIPFQDARRRYCLPVLDPHLIKCEYVPINSTTCESADGFVKFKSLNVSTYDEDTGKTKYIGTGLYRITSPFPPPPGSKEWETMRYRIDDEGKGVMVFQNYMLDDSITLIGAANAWGEVGCASMLHRLMFDGEDPDTSEVPDGATYDFAARCKLQTITDEDNVGSSWRQVDFTLKSGVLRANVTDERCPNARASGGKIPSGFADLGYALEGAAAVISGSDGWSGFFNEHPPTGSGTNIFANMTRFDTVVNQIYHIVQTHWTESSHKYAMEVPIVTDQPITMTSFPHRYVIRISWTPTTYVGLVLSILIALNSWILAARWLRAKYRFGFGSETWNLLRPVDLMAYSLAAAQDLIPALNTRDHRKMEMRGNTRTILREYPLNPLSLMTGIGKMTGTESYTSTPVREYEEKAGEVGGAGVSVRERNEDLEGRPGPTVPRSPEHLDGR